MLGLVAIILPAFVFVGFLMKKYYFSGGVCKCQNQLNDKVVVITGSNCGIGYETALDLAKRGAHVILACRDMKKAEKAANNIISESKNEKVECQYLDLASLESIREFCNRFKQKFSRLDILINNAGLHVTEKLKTADGFQLHFGVNHLGHFYLTNLLIDLLKRSAPSRVINVSSMVHAYCKMNWNDVQTEKKCSPLLAYQRSKLANVLFTKELAKRYKDDGIVAVCLHPGAVKSDIWRYKNEKIYLYYIFKLAEPFIQFTFKDCKQGAQTTIHCAVSDEVLEKSGAYFSDCKVKAASSHATNPKNAERLWEISEKLVGLN